MASAPRREVASAERIAVGKSAMTTVLPDQSEAATRCWRVALKGRCLKGACPDHNPQSQSVPALVLLDEQSLLSVERRPANPLFS
jgi:hypothetical protein